MHDLTQKRLVGTETELLAGEWAGSVCQSESTFHQTKGANNLLPSEPVDTILTNPPYMQQLDYGRDNRLRLWFFGCDDWQSLDNVVSPREEDFLTLMTRCFERWKTVLRPGGYCVLVIGDACSRADRTNLPHVVSKIATEHVGGYSIVLKRTDVIPNDRRVRRGIVGSASETILVLRNTGSRLHDTQVSRKSHATTL